MKKQCTKCGRILDHSEFFKRKNRKIEVYSWCKECISKYLKERCVSLKRETMTKFGGRCVHVDKNGVRCMKNIIDNPEELDLSHPNGDGDEHRHLISKGQGGCQFYRALQKIGYDTGKFVVQVMCKFHHGSLDRSGKKNPAYKEGKHNNPDWLKEKYKIMTLQEIGDLCGVSDGTIWNRMIEFGHSRRKSGRRKK